MKGGIKARTVCYIRDAGDRLTVCGARATLPRLVTRKLALVTCRKCRLVNGEDPATQSAHDRQQLDLFGKGGTR